ncbi:MAG: hypothetical protein ACKOBV_07145 [Candidatus Kapaibacterium sp.]
MKTVMTLLVVFLVGSGVFAQAPEKLSYEFVVNNATGTLVSNRQVGMRLSLLQGSSSGTAVYVETQTPTTNVNGLAKLEIGGGTVVSGTIAGIDWSAGPYYLKTEIDITGGASYSQTVTNQLLSSSYALYAKNAGSVGIADVSVTTAKIANNAVTGAKIALGSDATGDMMVYNGTDYVRLPVGTNGQVLKVTSGSPAWGAESGGGGSGFTHYVGEYYGGGVVFSVWKDSLGAEHGLVVSTFEIITGTRNWSATNTVAIGASARSMVNGLGNSNAIIAQNSNSCAYYARAHDGGGFNDWYLPSVGELVELFSNRFIVDLKLSTISGAETIDYVQNYWSSTETGAITAAIVQNGDVSYYSSKKDSMGRVRAVRTY